MATSESPSIVAAVARRGTAVLALIVSAVAFVVTALVVLVGHPVGGTARLHSTADYLFTAMLVPVALSVLGVGRALHAAQAGRDGRSGRVGLRILATGEVAFVVAAVVTLVTADPDSTGPLYPLAMLATIVGLVCMAVGAARGRVLPAWVLPALTLGWIFGGPIAAGGSAGGSAPIGFRGATLVFAAIAVGSAIGLARGHRVRHGDPEPVTPAR